MAEVFEENPKVETPRRDAVCLGSENLLFHMPSDPEYFMSALAAVESYKTLRDSDIENSKKQKVDYYDYRIYFKAKQQFLFMVDFDVMFPYTEPTEKMEWDMEIYLDPERAINIARDTERSLYEGFCMLIGANPERIFPSFFERDIQLKDLNPEVLIIRDLSRNFGDVAELIRFNFEDLKIRFTDQEDLTKMFYEIKNCCAVIGMQGSATYMAAAQRKITIEISKSTYWRKFLSKFDSPYYSLLYGGEPTPSLIFKAFQIKATNSRLFDRIKK